MIDNYIECFIKFSDNESPQREEKLSLKKINALTEQIRNYHSLLTSPHSPLKKRTLKSRFRYISLEILSYIKLLSEMLFSFNQKNNEFDINTFIITLPKICIKQISKDRNFLFTFSKFSVLVQIWNNLSQTSK